MARILYDEIVILILVIVKVFAQRLKELRQEKNLTQVQLAEQLKFKHYTVITQWESGRRMPDIENLVILAQFFSVTIDYLVGIEK